MAIEPGTTQYLRYGNVFLRGLCRSKDCVLVFWGQDFAHSVSADTWNTREFVREPARARLLSGEEAQQAQAFLTRKP